MKLLSLIFLTVACGSSATMGDDDDGPGPGPDPEAPPNNGFVAVSSYSGSANGTAFQGGAVSATFSSTPEAFCTEDKVDNCSVYACPMGQTQPAHVSAGNLSVAGAREPVAMSPQADHSYMAFIAQQPLFSGGESLTIAGSGADVPGFSATVVAPSRVAITSPAKPAANARLVIDRSRPLNVAWSGGGAGKVFAYVSGTNTGVMISCGFDASAGSGSIPASILGMLPTGDASFSASSLSSSSVDVDDWRVFATAFFSSVWPDQSIASALATLQ